MPSRPSAFASTAEAAQALLGGTSRERKKARTFLRDHGDPSCANAVLDALRHEVANDVKRPGIHTSSIDELLEIVLALELHSAVPLLRTLSDEATIDGSIVYWTLGEALQRLDRPSHGDARHAIACIERLEAHESPQDGSVFRAIQSKLCEFDGCMRGMAKLRLVPGHQAIERMLAFAEHWSGRIFAPTDDPHFNPDIYMDPRNYLALIAAIWPEDLVRPFLLRFRETGQADEDAGQWIENSLQRVFRPPWQ